MSKVQGGLLSPIHCCGRIRQLQICGGLTPTPNECLAYGTKQSDDEAPVMQEFWGMRINSSFPSLSGPLWPGMVAPKGSYLWIK